MARINPGDRAKSVTAEQFQMPARSSKSADGRVATVVTTRREKNLVQRLTRLSAHSGFNPHSLSLCSNRQLMQPGAAVEKVQFPPKQTKLRGYKIPGKLRKSFVEHPGAILFLPISRPGVFQQPQESSPTVQAAEQSASPQYPHCFSLRDQTLAILRGANGMPRPSYEPHASRGETLC